jgi:hypothetical protein
MHTADRDTASRVSSRYIVALLLIAALVPYAQTVGYGYLLDDTTVIRANPDIQGWKSLVEVWRQPYGGFRLQGSGLYRPLTMTLFAFLWNAGGHWPLWFHVVSVAMHMAAAFMVWRLLVPGLSGHPWPAMIAALWFAVHPVHVEAVASIANSSEILVAFWTCALALYLRRAAARPGPIGWPTAAGCGLLYLSAFLSKESGAVAPALAALWVWGWRPGTGAMNVRDVSRVVARWWRAVAGCLAAAAIVFTLRAVVLDAAVPGKAMVAPGLDDLSAPERIWAMLSLGPTIIKLLVWPSLTNPHYGPTSFPRTAVAWWVMTTVLVVSIAIAVALLRAKRGDRRMLAALGWTAVAFLPASNLVIPTGQILGERTLYVPSIGIAMLVGLAVEALWSASTTPRWRMIGKLAATTAAISVIAVFAVRAARSASLWRAHRTLFARMIAADSLGYRGYWLSGMDARYRGDFAEGLALLAKAYALYPRDRALLVEYSAALSHAGEYRRAAAIASQLMNWPESRRDPRAVAFYLAALNRAYGPDSVAAGARRLAPDAGPAPGQRNP